MYTWTDNTDQNLKPKQIWPRSKTWRYDLENSTVRSAIFKSNSLGIQIHLLSPPLRFPHYDFRLKNGTKNGAHFVLNCAAIFKFWVFQHFAECWGGSRDASLPIANFDFKMVSKNCANFVLKCAVIFKFCAVSLPEIPPRRFWEPAPPHCEFRLENGPKNCANFVLNCAAIYSQ